MSQDEQDDKNFLSRWSQRKREAKLQDNGTAASKLSEEAEATPGLATEGTAEKPFDLSILPKLEDITEATDIRVFLLKGVPESLRNAALRKAWALDPAIRNYVNPALDYAYDWNTPGGVPGNSELEAGTDIAKMVRQIMGSDPEPSAPQNSDVEPRRGATEAASANPGISTPQVSPPDHLAQQLRLSDTTTPLTPASAESGDFIQPMVEDPDIWKSPHDNASQQEVRRHGTAKPRI